jgi:hypothetical protein
MTKEEGMGRTRSRSGKKMNACRILLGKTERMRPRRITRKRFGDIIKMGLTEGLFCSMNWIGRA